VVRVEGDSNR